MTAADERIGPGAERDPATTAGERLFRPAALRSYRAGLSASTAPVKPSADWPYAVLFALAIAAVLGALASLRLEGREQSVLRELGRMVVRSR